MARTILTPSIEPQYSGDRICSGFCLWMANGDPLWIEMYLGTYAHMGFYQHSLRGMDLTGTTFEHCAFDRHCFDLTTRVLGCVFESCSIPADLEKLLRSGGACLRNCGILA